MSSLHKKRFWFIGFLFTGLCCTAILILLALEENLNHFYSPSQIVEGMAPISKTVRGGGIVVPNSMVRDPNTLKVSFKITDGQHSVEVSYEGLLPDLFAEGKGVIATGHIDHQHRFIAKQLLHKHSENYMPPEITKTIKSVQEKRQNQNYKGNKGDS